MFKRIKRFFNHLTSSFFGGMKTAEETAFRAPDIGNSTQPPAIVREVHQNRVAKDLLAGKETQQVRELRYRTYTVDRESKKYEYYSPFLSKKRTAPKDIPDIYDKSDGLNVIVIQENMPIVENVGDGLEQVGERGKRQKYWIEIDRGGKFIPRYRLEEYTRRLVVKEPDEDSDKVAILEFYVSKYPNEEDLKSKGFVREIEHMMEDENFKGDIVTMDYVHFTTMNAFGVDDLVEFRFRKPYLQAITEYKGNYVLRFRAGIVVNGHDIVEEYYEKSIAEKYANKEPRNNFGATAEEIKTYTCELCGKTLRDDDEDTEKYDMQITKETVGKMLCRDCLKKITGDIEEWKDQSTHS